MSDELFKTYIRAVLKAENNWQQNFVLPYGSAYTTARAKFKETLDNQKKADEERQKRIAALAMFALSLCGGSLLTHVFGSACAKTLAGQFVVDQICQREMNRAFKVVSFVNDNKTAQFAVGKLWDSGIELLPDLKGKLAETTTNFPSLTKFAQEPQVLQNKLEQWVRSAYGYVLSAEEEISANVKDEKTKTAMITQLLEAPFIRAAPTREVPEDSIAEDIEFTFYMNVIRDLDYLEQVTFDERPRGWTKKTKRLGSIDASPGSSEYPKHKNLGWGGADYQHVAFDRFGDVLRDRVDELHKKRFNKTRFFLSDEKISEHTITRAEQKLTEMSHVNLELIRRTLAGGLVSTPYGSLRGKDWKSNGSFPASAR